MDGARVGSRVRWTTGRARWPLVLAAVLGLAACQAVHPTVSELRTVPGASATYPTSVAVHGVAATEGRHTLFDSSPSMLLATYCTTDGEMDVVSWFAASLESDGWQSVPNPPGSSTSDVARTVEWRRGDRRFTVQVLTPVYVGRLDPALARRCTTAYRTVAQ